MTEMPARLEGGQDQTRPESELIERSSQQTSSPQFDAKATTLLGNDRNNPKFSGVKELRPGTASGPDGRCGEAREENPKYLIV
ncbi:hypothetical protein RRG08_003658 [Elysia crispata]|uniref:Uncharacterized protein n=1 Tax=Elysia crispata TaxID=231223 RepID=A0AAE1E581_9GAST|nr:hypothetical protein RRG08_003658 [Elysia crispata]